MTRLVIYLMLAQAVAGNCAGQSPHGSLGEERWADPDFSKVDFESIEAEIRLRRPRENPGAVSYLVRRNLQYLFFNRLNRDHFLAPPQPRDVAERVLVLLRMNREIGLSIASGIAALKASETPLEKHAQRDLIRHIEDSAKRLRQQFGEFFVESREASFSFQIPAEDGRGKFLHFVRQAQQINQQLTREMEDYFLAESPGAIHLSDYQRVTISVLTESLQRLCKKSRQGL